MLKSSSHFAIALTFLVVSAKAVADPVVIITEPVPREAIRPALPPGKLVSPLEVDMAAAKTFIRIGFGLDESINFQSTEMLTPRLRTVQAQDLIRMVESYNNFEGKKVADALTEFRGTVSGVAFGREGSPVLYIDLPYWTHQREEVTTQGKGQKIPEGDTQKVVKRLKAVFVDGLLADEFSQEGNQVRIWWD